MPRELSARFTSAIIACLLFVGCTATGGSGGILKPWTWGRQAAASKVEKAESKIDRKADELVHIGHVEALKANLAATKVAASYPEDKHAELARRASSNAVGALSQIDTVTVEELREAISIVEGWASAEASKREAAEAAQLRAEKQAEETANALAALQREVSGLRAKAASEAAHNAELANELMQERWYKWGGVALSGLATLAAVAYRMNLGRLQEGVADGLAKLQGKFGGSDEDLREVKAAIDAATSRGQQAALSALVGRFIAKGH